MIESQDLATIIVLLLLYRSGRPGWASRTGTVHYNTYIYAYIYECIYACILTYGDILERYLHEHHRRYGVKCIYLELFTALLYY